MLTIPKRVALVALLCILSATALVVDGLAAAPAAVSADELWLHAEYFRRDSRFTIDEKSLREHLSKTLPAYVSVSEPEGRPAGRQPAGMLVVTDAKVGTQNPAQDPFHEDISVAIRVDGVSQKAIQELCTSGDWRAQLREWLATKEARWCAQHGSPKVDVLSLEVLV